jgi:hypothetical protein
MSDVASNWCTQDRNNPVTSAEFRGLYKGLTEQMWGVNPTLPIRALEYSSKASIFHGKSWTEADRDRPTFADTVPYWARTCANVLHMLSLGKHILPLGTLTLYVRKTHASQN